MTVEKERIERRPRSSAASARLQRLGSGVPARARRQERSGGVGNETSQCAAPRFGTGPKTTIRIWGIRVFTRLHRIA